MPSTTPQTGTAGPMIRAMRLGCGLSLEQLAARVPDADGNRPSISTLSRFETGQRHVSPDLLARITRAIADAMKGTAA